MALLNGESFTPPSLAACQSPGLTRWFFPPNDNDLDRRHRIGSGDLYAVAERFCSACPSVAECREWAVLTNQEIGYWGGTTPNQRKAERASRQLPPNQRKEYEADDSKGRSEYSGRSVADSRNRQRRQLERLCKV